MFITKKVLLARIKYLEGQLENGYIPRRSDACGSCEKSVLCRTAHGDYYYRCITDVQKQCPAFKLATSQTPTE